MGGSSKYPVHALSWPWFYVQSWEHVCVPQSCWWQWLAQDSGGFQTWCPLGQFYFGNCPWHIVPWCNWFHPQDYFAVWDGVCSAVIRLSHLDMLTRNGPPLTNMQSTARVTIQCQSRIILRICTYSRCTGWGVSSLFFPLVLWGQVQRSG